MSGLAESRKALVIAAAKLVLADWKDEPTAPLVSNFRKRELEFYKGAASADISYGTSVDRAVKEIGGDLYAPIFQNAELAERILNFSA